MDGRVRLEMLVRGDLELFFLVPVGIIVFKPKLRHVCRQTTSLVPGLEVPRALWASESDRLWAGSAPAPATYNWGSVFVVNEVLRRFRTNQTYHRDPQG